MTLPEKITLVLRAPEGGTLKPILPFLKLGDQFAAEGFTTVIAGVSDEDLLQVLGQEREERQMQAELWEAAIGAPAHLVAHAQEMLNLLHRINVKVGGVNAVINHGGEPSDLMWEEYDATLAAIWELLSKVQNDASVDAGRVNQIAQECENVNQHQDDLEPDLIAIIAALQQKISLMEAPLDIDDRVRMTADARRYRWLRGRDSATDPVMSVTLWTQVSADKATGAAIAGEDLDQAVDAALQLEVQEQQVMQDTQEQQP